MLRGVIEEKMSGNVNVVPDLALSVSKRKGFFGLIPDDAHINQFGCRISTFCFQILLINHWLTGFCMERGLYGL